MNRRRRGIFVWNWFKTYILDKVFPPAIVIKGGNMSRVTIAVINESTVLTDAQITPYVVAQQMQVTQDFAPIWGQDATIIQVKKGQTPPAGSWWAVILDNSDLAGALGYHDLTSEGLPLAKIFAGTDIQYGNVWTVTASHEVLEMLGDPYCGTCVQNGNMLYAYENCDAVEADNLGYWKVVADGSKVKLSDFVYPNWFSAAGTGKLDWCGKVTKPFQLAAGGYISVLQLSGGEGWQQIFAQEDNQVQNFQSRARVGSRRERRRTRFDQWVKSQPGWLRPSR